MTLAGAGVHERSVWNEYAGLGKRIVRHGEMSLHYKKGKVNLGNEIINIGAMEERERGDRERGRQKERA